MTLIDEIKAAADLAANWQPKHPQYIEGAFYLTQDQWNAIRAEWPIEPGRNTCQAIYGIPVFVIKPGDPPTKLTSGKVLIYSEVMSAFYVGPDPVFSPRR